MPLVTVIVLCYNQARFVRETLESVLAQTYARIQLIVIDDFSSDKSVEVINQWIRDTGIHCIFIPHYEKRGICRSLNEGLHFALGKYISTLASDDVLLPDKIERQVEIMETQPDNVGVIYSDAFQIDEGGQPLPDMFIAAHRELTESPSGRLFPILLEGNFIPGMTALVRRICYTKVGTYDETLPWEDWDMWLRIARYFSFLYSPRPSAKYRVHAHSYTRSKRAAMLVGSCKICMKLLTQDISTEHKTILMGQFLYAVESLYECGDENTPAALRSLWKATRKGRFALMYLFARLGLPYRLWRTFLEVYAKVSPLVPKS